MNSLILITDIVEKLILISLFGLSIWSVSIIIDRKRQLKNELNQELFQKLEQLLITNNMEAFRTEIQKNNLFFTKALKLALENNSSSESMDRSVASFVKKDRGQLEKGLSVLATLGANAPFIGLFGTVLGIIRAFAYLGSSTGSAAVMSGVSQALYATAMGLFVAIPAVVAFNIYSHRIKTVLSWTESLRDLLIAKTQSQK
jgi:biopolymer transport protein ExbB/TolQ